MDNIKRKGKSEVKSKGKKAKSGGEVSFFDKTFFQTLGKFDQKASRKKVLGIVLAVIMIASVSASIVASPITDQSSYVESEMVRNEDVVKAMSVEDLNLNIVPKTFKDLKMESIIAQIIDVSETNPAGVQSFASMHDISIVDGRIRVVLELTDDNAALEDANVNIETRYKNLVQALVPISELKEIARDPAVYYIRLPLRAYPMITSEGVGVINADELHAIGIKGDGIKIAVIDGGFEGYTTNPEIPSANIAEVKSFRADGDIEAGSEHGSACAEIVLDVAPNASLYLYNFQYDIEFINATKYAISKGVHIISCSCGFLAGPFNGTGPICEVVDDARTHGILFAESAGNQAERHYEGKYTDTDGDNWHEFSTSPKDETLLIGDISAYDLIGFYLSWDDWQYSDQDYDLYFYYYYAGDWYYIKSDNPQTGTQHPKEVIAGYFVIHIEDSYVKIKRYSATRDVHFELYSAYQDLKEHNVPSSSLCIPADAAGAMTAGATYWDDDSLESFSSQGPTNDGRIKPDVTAPDGVSTYAYGSGKFYGTSASAPHVAGAAALLLSGNQSLTPDQLQSTLEKNAIDLGVPG